MSKADQFFKDLLARFKKLAIEKGILNEEVVITGKVLNTTEALGQPSRTDFPLLSGKEFLMEADFLGAKGQAFTNSPGNFSGSINTIINTLPSNNFELAVLISTINAVGRKMGLCDKTVHCKNQGPELCAVQIAQAIKKENTPLKIALVGYQPSILENLSHDFEVRCLDLDENRIGARKFGVLVEHGEKARAEVLDWCDLVLATGSTLCNGTITQYLGSKEVYFFGTTISATAALMGLNRFCFCAE